jgi:DNA-binding NarL/FixJ family response regulator
MEDPEKILIIDDHPSYLEGVSLLLKSILPNAVIVSALNGKATREILVQYSGIDWILLDINLPDCSGIGLIQHFKDIKLLANIIVITSEDDPDLIDQSLRLHANGFLTKDFNREVLSECIKVIKNGGIFLTQKHAKQLENYRESLFREKQLIENAISQRQQQTLLLIAKGYSNSEIAEYLGISESTVKTHVSSLISLFDSDNRTHCVAEARRLKFID